MQRYNRQKDGLITTPHGEGLDVVIDDGAISVFQSSGENASDGHFIFKGSYLDDSCWTIELLDILFTISKEASSYFSIKRDTGGASKTGNTQKRQAVLANLAGVQCPVDRNEFYGYINDPEMRMDLHKQDFAHMINVTGFSGGSFEMGGGIVRKNTAAGLVNFFRCYGTLWLRLIKGRPIVPYAPLYLAIPDPDPMPSNNLTGEKKINRLTPTLTSWDGNNTYKAMLGSLMKYKKTTEKKNSPKDKNKDDKPIQGMLLAQNIELMQNEYIKNEVKQMSQFVNGIAGVLQILIDSNKISAAIDTNSKKALTSVELAHEVAMEFIKLENQRNLSIDPKIPARTQLRKKNALYNLVTPIGDRLNDAYKYVAHALLPTDIIGNGASQEQKVDIVYN